MKPRRTFESVVTELIDGFHSGKVVLDEASSVKLSSDHAAKDLNHLIAAQTLAGALDLESFDRDRLGSIHSTARQSWFFLPEIINKFALVENRLWLLGPWWNYHLVTAIEEGGLQYTNVDIRILVSQPQELDSDGSSIIRSLADAFLIEARYTDLPILCSFAIVDDYVFYSSGKSNPTMRNVLINEKSEPDLFNHLNQIYSEVWKLARTEHHKHSLRFDPAAILRWIKG